MEKGEEASASPLVLWGTVGTLLLLAIVSFMDRGIISLMIDPIRHDLHISDFQVSLLQGTAFILSYSLFTLPMGALLDRYSRRWIVYVGVTAWSLATVSAGLGNTYLSLFLARLGVGAGESTLNPAAFSIISDLAPKRTLSLAVCIYLIGTSAGISVALAVGGSVMAKALAIGTVIVPVLGILRPWQLTFIVAGIPGLLLAPLIFLFPETKRRRERTDVGIGEFVRFLKPRRTYFVCSLLGYGTVAMLGIGLYSWFPVYLLRRFHMPIAEVGALVGGISAFSATLGFLFVGWVSDRWFARGIKTAHFRLGIIAACILFVLGGAQFFTTNPTECVILLAGMQFTCAITGAGVAHLQIITPSQFRGRASALYMLLFMIMGAGLGPSAVALVTDFVLHDSQRVGTSLAIIYVVFTPVVAVALALGSPSAASAVDAIEA